MTKRLSALVATVAASALTAPVALATSAPVGKLPPGPTRTVALERAGTFTVALPKPALAGGVWRVARAFDGGVVREVGEGDSKSGGVWVRFRAVAPGSTRVVFALTRGETARAYAARTFRFDVGGTCPSLQPLGINPIAPAVAAALRVDAAKNRPSVTAAIVAPSDTVRGGQAKAECGEQVWRRTVVVYITDTALLPSQSAAQRVVYVGRTKDGYNVWKRVR